MLPMMIAANAFRDYCTIEDLLAIGPSTDGQGSYFGFDVRTIVNDRFRSYTLTCNPQLLQSLSAEKRCDAAFDSVEHLKFHLLDMHCPDFVKEPNVLEILKQEDDVKSTSLRRRRKQAVEISAAEKGVKAEFQFN
ncbi:hypothetical protein GGS23DRAFT_612226 [Durotheca rogersii]|uniref:uncharacterized protein n=1 Tax=Durotheca rogersii TaxID=419775 RepID=UPI002220ADB1|nr:uncharacterized protein GGS23DRAFT_612226 [Durotheca rogersii]KAI5861259.1 hypothetical protein GGS23DRAFT_612226 [Durotheca rogersii]